MTEQISFGQFSFDPNNSFADNAEPRCPLVLLLDVSGSMSGAPLQALNDGLVTLKDELAADSLAMKRVEISIVTFGPAQIHTPFTSASSFYPPILTPQGDTPMGEAIRQGVELVRQRKEDYRANGIPYYRPWIFLITDGGPTDEWHSAAAQVREGEESKKFAFFSIGVQGANMDVLRQISSRAPISLQGLKFRELFSWLSSSLKSVSQSTPGELVALPPPSGWSAV